MKPKSFAILAILTLILIGLAWWHNRTPFAPPPAMVGTKLLPDFPINDSARIEIRNATNQISLVKTQGIWTVTGRWNYPAKFSKVVETLQELDSLKIGQVINVPESDLAKFDLLTVASGTNWETITVSNSQIQVFNQNDQELASIIIGKPFMSQGPAHMGGSGGYPNGQYVRAGDGQVYIVAKTLRRMTEDIKYWLDDEFVNLPEEEINSIIVNAPDQKPIKLLRDEQHHRFVLEDLNSQNEEMVPGKASEITGALAYLGFDDVASPELSAEQTGLNHPIVATVATRSGQTYTLRIGNTVSEDSHDRYAQISVNFTPPAEPAAADTNEVSKAEAAPEAKEDLTEKTKTLNAKFGSWIYTIKSYRAEPFLVKRDDLVQTPAEINLGESKEKLAEESESQDL